MYAGRVGIATLVCGMLVFVGWSTTGGQSVRPATVVSRAGPRAQVSSATATAATPATSAGLVAAVSATTAGTIKARPKVRNVTVYGVARGAGGVTYRGVRVGFRRTTCPGCAPMTVTTDRNGAYAVSVPIDTYVVTCVATPQVCTVAGSEDLSATVTVRSDAILDISVRVESGATGPRRGGGHVVYGHVLTTAGLPVPRTTIQLIRRPHWLPPHGGQTFFTDTVPDGSYGVVVDAGVFLIACITPNPGYRCGPTGGDGSPFTVTAAAQPQRVDFVLCRSADYPGCLTR